MRAKPLLSLAVAFVALAALGWFYWLGLTSVAGQVHDDVVYIVTGKALADLQGYRIISQPGNPLQIGYPPLYPLALALLWKLFPDFPANLWGFKGLNVACALAGLVLTYALVVKAYGAPRWQGWLTAGLLALSGFYFSFMDLTMSELFFAVFLLGALYVLERLPDSPQAGKRWAAAAIALVAVLPFLVRTIGITLVAAVVVWLLVRRQWKLAAASGAWLAAAVAPWVAWGWWAKRQAETSWDYMSWTASNTGGFSLAALGRNVLQNGSEILTQSIPFAVAPILQHEHLTGLLARWSAGAWAGGLAVAVTALTAVGFVRLLKQRLRLVHVLMAIYLILILVYPWAPSRFIVALTPLLLFAFVQGACWLADTWSRPRSTSWAAKRPHRWRPVLAWGLASVAIALSLSAGCARAVSFARHQVFHDALLPPAIQLQQSDERALVSWAKAHMPEDGVWLHRRDPLLYLLTGRKAISYADGPDPAPPRKALFRQHPAYLVVYPEPNEQFTTHRALLEAHLDKVQLVFKPPGGTFSVYRLSREW